MEFKSINLLGSYEGQLQLGEHSLSGLLNEINTADLKFCQNANSR